MNMTNPTLRWCLATGAAITMGALAACSGGTPEPGESGNASEGSTTAEIAFWDPYPQHAEGSAWDEHVKSCAPDGSTIVLTTAVKEGGAPDVVLLDNPMMPEAVAAGMLATAEQAGIDTSGVDENLMGPGVVDGTAYGVPFGSNALGLYYNADLLAEAGVDPASVTDWDSLNAAMAQVVAKGGKGITFSGVTGEEGVFQFLPWFWGAGADLSDISSDEAVAAGRLLSDWIGDGLAPKSAATDNQSAAWDLFLTGEYAFAENGSWFAAAAAEAGFEVGVIPIPAKDGGVAPVPTGGEFAVAPIQAENASDHYANASAVIACLTEGEAAFQTNETLGYLSAKPEVRAEQAAQSPLWEPWVAAVEGAQGRTTDLGSAYVDASASLSGAIQAALNAAGDQAAVEAAFQDAGGF
jgi:multiple sugar transport system substrate-binding protein